MAEECSQLLRCLVQCNAVQWCGLMWTVLYSAVQLSAVQCSCSVVKCSAVTRGAVQRSGETALLGPDNLCVLCPWREANFIGYCQLHTVCYTLNTASGQLHTVCYTLNTAHGTQYVIHLTLHTVNCTQYVIHLTLHTVNCTQYVIHLTLQVVNCTQYIIHQTMNDAYYTLHSEKRDQKISAVVYQKMSKLQYTKLDQETWLCLTHLDDLLVKILTILDTTRPRLNLVIKTILLNLWSIFFRPFMIILEM